MALVSVMVKPVSGRCNMRCGYCFYADETARRQTPDYGRMQDSTLENLIRRALLQAEGQLFLVFQGGEPLLAGAPFYRRVLELERAYNVRGVSVAHAIQTNGLCLDDDMIAVLKEGHFLVGVSLDGTREIHDSRRLDAAGRGTYDRVCQSIDRLRRAGVDYNVLCVVDSAVARHPRQVFDALAPHQYLQFIPCLDPLDQPPEEDSLSPEDYGRFLIETYHLYARTLRKGQILSERTFDNWLGRLLGRPPESCAFSGVCAANCLVEANGNVYPCDFYALDEWLLGNINETSFPRLIRSERMAAFLARSAQPAESCRDCPYAFLCMGGCYRDRLPGGPNRLCPSYRMFFDACLDDMRALAREVAHI